MAFDGVTGISPEMLAALSKAAATGMSGGGENMGGGPAMGGPGMQGSGGANTMPPGMVPPPPPPMQGGGAMPGMQQQQGGALPGMQQQQQAVNIPGMGANPQMGGGGGGMGGMGGCCNNGGGGMGGCCGGGGGMSAPGGLQIGSADSPQAISAKLDCHPLVGESGLFDGGFYHGFWKEPIFRGPEDTNPFGATHPPGKVVQPTLTAAANAATLARFKTPEACRYGDRCRHKLSCSRFHGTDTTYHAINCACEDDRCPLGHPLRAGRDRTGGTGEIQPQGQATAGGGRTGGPPSGRRPPATYVCAKCRAVADHYLNECPQNTCFRCGQQGHIATHCTNERVSDKDRKRDRPASIDVNDDRNTQPRTGGAPAAMGGPGSGPSPPAMGGPGGGFGGGGLRPE